MSEKNNLPAGKQKASVATRRIKSKKSKSEQLLIYAKRFFAQFGTALIAVSVVAYVFLQLMLNVGTILDTENAVYVDITERAELDAFLFRDEALIPSGAEGTDCYLAEDGDKVRLGEQLAVTYSDPGDVEIQKRISEIDKRIDVLERSSLSTGASTTNITLLDTKINELMLSIVRRADTNEFDKILREKEELLILLNRRQSVVQADSYASELSSLSREKAQLTESLSGASYVVEAPQSGYFYGKVDGYEADFTIDRLKNLTCEEFETLADSVPNQSIIEDSSGKIVLSSTWYIAVALDKRTAETFRDGYAYPVVFQYSNNTELDMTLERRITRSDKDMTVLIFSTKVMPEGFDYSRCQTVELAHSRHEGLRVSSSALRVKDGETGVYVVVGSKVIFKKTEVLYTYGSYSVCAIPKNPAYPNRKDIAYSSNEKLSLHDAVVVDGQDIYDGMRLT